MPTYQYRCTQCATELEVVQKFSDAPLTRCPECEGTLRKVYSAVGVVFKGSGFYATDNRSKKGSGASKPADAASGAKKSEPKPTESKPAASTASTSSSTTAA